VVRYKGEVLPGKQMRGQVRAQEREIRVLQRAGISTAAELLLCRRRAKLDDLCGERENLRGLPVVRRTQT
jgi:hypothetical protein